MKIKSEIHAEDYEGDEIEVESPNGITFVSCDNLSEQMKLEFFVENSDKISLEKLEQFISNTKK